jgi:hypothetical protein
MASCFTLIRHGRQCALERAGANKPFEGSGVPQISVDAYGTLVSRRKVNVLT